MSFAMHSGVHGDVRGGPATWLRLQAARPVASALHREPFGDTAPWSRWLASPEEVYVWRAQIAGAKLTQPADALMMLRAVAAAQDLSLDAKAVAVGPGSSFDIVTGPGGRIDIIMAADSTIPYVSTTDAEELAAALLADPTVRTRYPQLSVSAPAWLQLTGPPAAVDFWRSRPTLWDDKVGPLDAFAKQQGVYRGTADDGPAAAQWAPSGQPPLGPPPPPQPKPDTDLDGGALPQLALAATVAVAVFAAATLISKERTR